MATSKSSQFDPKEFVLMRKALIDDYLRVTIELNKSILWLKNERERLIAENERVMSEADELNISAQKLMKMYRELETQVTELREENSRLLEATKVFGQPGSERMN